MTSVPATIRNKEATTPSGHLVSCLVLVMERLTSDSTCSVTSLLEEAWERYAINRISWIIPESTYITYITQESSDKKSPTLYITEEMGPANVIQESSQKEKSPTLYIAEEMGPVIVMQETSEKENLPTLYITEEMGPAIVMQES